MDHKKIELATLGGGCFWCLEAVFQNIRGVESVTSGYAGGSADTANYEAVCSGTTRHAEVVQIGFDPGVVNYEDILEIFWNTHDPTTPNRQGNDVGPQYRSVIFYHDDTQKTKAEHSKSVLAPTIWPDPIVTEIELLEAFYEAETYHHNYYNKVGNRNPYCTYVISPKVNKLRKDFAEKLKA